MKAIDMAQRLVRGLAVAALCSSAAIAAAASTITYYHNDLAGSPMLATDENRQVIWRETYRPYGDRLNNSAAAASNKIWFTSRVQDVESGLVYMGARHYDPVAGRFTSVDPVQFVVANVHSFNRYAYANNNPYRFKDPDGRTAAAVAGAVGGALIVGGGFATLTPEQQKTAIKAIGWLGEHTLSGQLAGLLSPLILNEGAKDLKRPEGVPDNWREEPTRGKGGRAWVNPDNAGDRIRVMPGNPDSPNESQRGPYVRDVRNGNQWLDVNGNRVEGKAGRNSPDTHIPVDDYKFRP